MAMAAAPGPGFFSGKGCVLRLMLWSTSQGLVSVDLAERQHEGEDSLSANCASPEESEDKEKDKDKDKEKDEQAAPSGCKTGEQYVASSETVHGLFGQPPGSVNCLCLDAACELLYAFGSKLNVFDVAATARGPAAAAGAVKLLQSDLLPSVPVASACWEPGTD